MATDSEEIGAYVVAHLQGAAQAVRQQNIEGVILCLDAAVKLYEEHPSLVGEPDSHLRDVLVCIRAARSVSKTLRRADDDLQSLEGRAEALRLSALH